MKLTITARSRDDFDVIVNSEELHKTKQSIFKVNITNADLHELTDKRVDKHHHIESTFPLMPEHDPANETNNTFNLHTLNPYTPEYTNTATHTMHTNRH